MTDRLLPVDRTLERLKALHPRSIDLSLDRMRRLCDELGNPERKLPPVIHVAGTNGKGSTVAFLRAIAEAAGLRVHVYTSPHLVRFAERIRIAGRLIDAEQLNATLDHVEAVNAGKPITFFEVTTAVAYEAFARIPADLCILEVGLGGILDATNVVDKPAVAAIAPVDIDHREFLGDTIELIAAEKAGILKPGVPGVIGRQSESALGVIELMAQRIGAPLTIMGRDFDAYAERDGLIFQGDDRLLDLPRPSLVGAHQVDNAGLAVAAIRVLNHPRIDDRAIAKGLQTATWPGRFQRLTEGAYGARAKAAGADLILDGGHNPHAARALVRTLEDLDARDPRPLVMVTGMLTTKDPTEFFAAFAPLKPRIFTTAFEEEAATPAETLATVARGQGLQAQACTNIDDAIDSALASASRSRVVICGSLYLAGEVLARSAETWPR
ncbi:MAG TPA: folylpolyglutamate synthase/dihydrofolate synthase family protein [Caulobacteraceae bacterium]|nr:folylpolyglutamate synthase/dihydrofolate synthase family protein [Caulobacteraceae bacterium]